MQATACPQPSPVMLALLQPAVLLTYVAADYTCWMRYRFASRTVVWRWHCLGCWWSAAAACMLTVYMLRTVDRHGPVLQGPLLQVVAIGLPLASSAFSRPLSSIDKFMTAQLFSSRVFMPDPLSLTHMTPFEPLSSVINDTVMLRGHSLLPLVARRELSTSSASAKAKG